MVYIKLFVLLLAYAMTQQDEVEIDSKIIEDEVDENEESPDSPDMLEQTQYGCVILTKYQLQSESDELLSIIKAFPSQADQHKIYQKIQAYHVLQCLQRINTQQLMDLFYQLRSQSFEFEQFQDIFMMMDLSQFKDPDYQITQTEQEMQVIEYINKFDKQMQEQKKQRKREEGDETDADEEDEEEGGERTNNRRSTQESYKVFGIDFSKLSQTTQLLILCSFALAVIFGSLAAVKYISDNTQGPQQRNKNKKDKKTK